MFDLNFININQCMTYLIAHPNLGMTIAFAVAFIESLAVIGSIIPGSMTMTLIGTMIGMGPMNLPLTLLLIWLGALSGDYLSYRFGIWSQRYESWLQRWNFLARMMEHGRNLFRRHGKKAIVIGRFISVSRSMVPMVAGLLYMKEKPFVIAAMISALLWTLIFTLPGVALGMYAITLPPEAMHHFLGLVFSAILAMIVLGIIGHPLLIGIERMLTQISLLIVSLIKRRYIAFRHYRHDPTIQTLTICIRNLLVAGCGFAIFAVIAHLYVDLGYFVSWNRKVYTFMVSAHNDNLQNSLLIFTLLAEKFAVIGFFTAVSWLCFCQRQFKVAAAFLGYGFMVFIAGRLIKYGFHIPRPPLYLATHSSHSYSFPSGHSLLSAAIIGAPLMIADLKEQIRQRLWIIHTLFVILVMLSRLIVGAHWFSDVFAGALLGYSMLPILATIRTATRLPKIPMATVGMLYGVWVLFVTAYAYQFWHKVQLYYAYPEAFTQKIAQIPLKDTFEFTKNYLEF